MPTLIVKSYAQTAMSDGGDAMGQLREPAASKEVLDITAAVNSAVFANDWIVVQSDVAFRVAFGVNPVDGNLVSEIVYPASTIHTFNVQRGHKLRAVTNV